MKHRVIPAPLEGTRDQTVGRVTFLIAPFSECALIPGAFKAHVPLTHDGAIALFEFVQGSNGELEFGRLQGGEYCIANRVVEKIAAHAHAIGGRQTFSAASTA